MRCVELTESAEKYVLARPSIERIASSITVNDILQVETESWIKTTACATSEKPKSHAHKGPGRQDFEHCSSLLLLLFLPFPLNSPYPFRQ